METNRHSHFITELETKLATITGLKVLTEFDLNSWQEVEMPYCYVELSPELLEYPYEDSYDIDGTQEVSTWFGIESPTDGDIRKVFSELTLKIEKLFKKMTLSTLSTSDFDLYTSSVKLKQIYPVNTFGQTKYLFLIIADVKYNQKWK